MRKITEKIGIIAIIVVSLFSFHRISYAEQIGEETVMEQEIQKEVEQSANAANNLAGRKFILLGDSYGDGWTPERMEVSWMARIKSAFGSENVYTCSEGGVGFCGYNSQRATYITLLQRLLPQIPDRNAITDIVPCGGLPDMRKTDAELIAGINNFVAYCREMFPNAKISYGAIGWGPTAYIQNFMISKYNNIYSNMASFGIYNMEPAYNALHGHPEWFSSDGNHPNGEGQAAIASSILNYLTSTRYLVGPSYTGLAKDPIDGQWYYATNGIQDGNYTGLVFYQGYWYYVQNGALNWKYTGLVFYQGYWYYVQNGALNWKYTGLVLHQGIWYYVQNGVKNYNYTGIVEYNGDFYYVMNGILNWGVNGAVKAGDTVYYLVNSTVNVRYSGLCMSEDKIWYYVEKGKLNANYTGLVYYRKDWYYVENGVLNWAYTGLNFYRGQWYLIVKGQIAWHTSTLVSYNNQWYYVQNGMINWHFNGWVEYNGGYYYITNGMIDWANQPAERPDRK